MNKKMMVLLLWVLLVSGCAERLIEIKQTEEHMGTTVTIAVMDSDAKKAKLAINHAFLEIERIEKLMSTYIENSSVSLLNKKSILENVDIDLVYVIKKAQHYSELSDGAFDITVQPILDLYRESFSVRKRAPSEEEIKKALELVNYKNLIVDDEKVRFRKRGMTITLGGIAKGYAIDRAIDVLELKGIKHALVNAGGDMRAIGMKSESESWKIALQNPRDKKEYITIIKLNNRSVATSGDYERYFEPTKKFHHIVNPKTGYSATELISATIVAEKAIDADALATSVFVMGAEKGMALIERLDNVEGLLITKGREVLKSSGFDG
jgi:thiamine biosynthesis lipoprotein